MTTHDEATRELTGIATRIRALGDRSRADGEDTRVLDRVADDLEAGGVSLAGTDLVAAYPPDVLLPDIPHRRLSQAESWVGVIRDILVFAPIALTWWRLRDALHAYDASKSKDPFLLGWARGFPQGNPPEHTTTTLGTSAIEVTLLIVLVIGMTLGLHAVQHLRERRLSREEERRRLASELALATYLLAAPAARPAGKPLDSDSANRLTAQLLASTVNLESALRRTSEEIVNAMETGPASRIQTALDGWTKTVDELTRLVRSLTPPDQLAQDLVRLREQGAEDQKQLRLALGSLAADLRRAQETTGHEIERHDRALRQVMELAQELGNTLLIFSERTGNVIESTRGIWQVVDRLDGTNGRPHRLDNADMPPMPPPPRSGS